MKKILVVALVALCAAFQGEVRADIPSLSMNTSEFSQTGMGEIELEWVLNQVVEQTGMTYHEVRSLYEAGEMVIQKTQTGYVVTYQTQDGGIGVIIGIDEL